jgi:hypothetical protein
LVSDASVVEDTTGYSVDDSEHTLDACSESEEEALESSGEDEDEYVPHERVAEDQPLAGSDVRQPSIPERQALVATNQTDFTVTARPTRIGRLRQTRDMADIRTCVCGTVVSPEEIDGGRVAMCTERGCETQWVSDTASWGDPCTDMMAFQFHLDCLNFEYVPKGWKCEIHARPTKKARGGYRRVND